MGMGRFIEGDDRQQVTLLPECLDDFIGEDNPVRVIDAFVGELELAELGFEGATPAATGRPSYQPPGDVAFALAHPLNARWRRALWGGPAHPRSV